MRRHTTAAAIGLITAMAAFSEPFTPSAFRGPRGRDRDYRSDDEVFRLRVAADDKRARKALKRTKDAARSLNGKHPIAAHNERRRS